MRNAIKMCSAALLLCTAVGCYADSDDGKDCEGCSDQALPARYPGSILLGADQKAYDEAIFPTSPAVKNDAGDAIAPKTLGLTGKRTRLFYIAPTGRSTLEVFANYRAALEKAGMTVVWTCSNDQQCGPDFLNQAVEVMQIKLSNTPEASVGLVLGEHPRYLLATRARPEGDVHVAVLAAEIADKQRPGVYVMQLEGKPMDKGMAETQSKPMENASVAVAPAAPAVIESKPVAVESAPAVVASKPVVVDSAPAMVESKPVVAAQSKPAEPTAPAAVAAPVNAAALNSDLANTGLVTLYGIHFDFDKADIKPESKPQIDEIAKALLASPSLKLRVAGYTDGIGTAEHNQGLSQRRADAIVAALVANYAIASGRLSAVGFGAAAPVAGNDTEEGRAKNRRVELRKQ